MSSQILSSVMEESYNLLRDFIKLAQCNRRKQVPTATSSRRSEKALASEGKRRSKAQYYDSDITTRSTEAGDSSNNEFSDRGTDVSSSVRAPPGLAPPPGLGFLGSQPTRNLNREAACFVPSSMSQAALKQASSEFPQNPQQLRQSIRMLKGALEEWEANLPAASPPPAAQQPSDQSLVALQQALEKLTPQEAATVRSILDSKVTPAPPPPRTHPILNIAERMNARRSEEVDSRAKPAAFRARPFTPFQGSCTPPWEQAKATAPKPDVPETSLASQLKELSVLDSSCIVMVRKINRLGLDAAGPLKEYFSQFGKVERIMNAPTLSKAPYGQQARVRPAPLGFVVMSSAQEVQNVLGFGVEHVVCGECIRAHPFQSHSIDEKK